MAKNVLPVDFQDDILAESMNGRRKYQMITNSDGTVSFVDVTEYTQVGSNFGQAQVNATNEAVNESADKNKIIDDKDDLVANSQAGMIAGALAVKAIREELNQNMNTTAITATGITCNKGTITAGGYTKIGSIVVISLRISLSETANSGDSIIINGVPRSANSGSNYIPINANVPVANGYMSPDGTITIVADGQVANGTVLIVGGCYISANMNL